MTVADGDVTRDIDYFEDEDESTAGNLTKLTPTTSSASAEEVIAATDLTNYDYLSFWVRATETGSTVRLGFGENASDEHEEIVHIVDSNTWQKIYWDISKLPSHEKDAVKFLKISNLGTTSNVIYFDNLVANRFLTDANGSKITSTPNEYLQYRAILTTARPGFYSTLHNVQFEWSNGYKVVQTDANNVRLYNYSGEAQELRLDAVVFGADLAEWYTVADDSIGAGDVVALTGGSDAYGVPVLKKATLEDKDNIIGAISTKAGKTLGLEADDRRLLGLAGRIPIKMDPASPPLVAGDYLTASPNVPGLAFRASPGDVAIAKAFESWHPPTDDKVTPVLSFITEPSPTPVLNLEAMKNFTVEKLTDGLYGLRDTVSDRLIAPLGVFSRAIIASLSAGRIDTEELQAGLGEISELKTDLISPLASDSALTIAGSVVITNPKESDPSQDPLLSVEGGIEAATISARLAQLEEVKTNKLYADEIVTGSITADSIVGLDAKIASLSAGTTATLSDSELDSITTRIKTRLQALVAPADTSTAADLPTPPEATSSGTLTPPNNYSLDGSEGQLLASLSADFATINDYLAVIGQATITSLDVTGQLYSESVSSKSNLLAIQPYGGVVKLASNTLIVDSTGEVFVNGNLSVTGTIYASNGQLGSLALGTPPDGTSSALGKLLAIYNEEGKAVATIDASGSANLKDLTTQLITIAAASDASQSASTSALAQTLGTSSKSNAAAGEAVLVTPNTQLTIESEFITDNSLVYLTPTTNTSNKVLFVKAKDTCTATNLYTPEPDCIPSFTVAIDTPASSDIKFNYWVIQLAPTKQETQQ